MTLKYKFYVAQIGCAVFGFGDTAAEAVAMANEFIRRDERLDVETISRYVGNCATGDRVGVRSMTQYGEVHHGELVLLDAAAAEGYGFTDVE